VSAKIPVSLLKATDPASVVEACYFVIRVLRNAGRGYQNPMVSTESSDTVGELAAISIAEIEKHEGRPVQSLDSALRDSYIAILSDLQDTVYRRALDTEIAVSQISAANILGEMRSADSA
jgi:hypothetical protein